MPRRTARHRGVVTYFRQFVEPADGEQVFGAVFGQRVDAFDRDLRRWHTARARGR
jgi:hypothetical protein